MYMHVHLYYFVHNYIDQDSEQWDEDESDVYIEYDCGDYVVPSIPSFEDTPEISIL